MNINKKLGTVRVELFILLLTVRSLPLSSLVSHAL